MSGQYGRSTVLRSLARMRRTGKVNAATLYVRASGDTFTAVTYANCYLSPVASSSGLGGGGSPSSSTTGYLWQIGESTAPSADDKLRDADGNYWLILGVTTRQNADSGFAVHDLHLMRSP